jgi:hypothetical protein
MSAPAPITTHQEIVRGDDYRIADQRALSWSSPQWPNLAGSTLTMVVGRLDPNIPAIAALSTVTWTGSVPAGPVTTTATLELTSAQTKQVPVDCLDYSLIATLADGDRVTLAIGKLTVQGEPAAQTFIPSP